MALPHAQSAQVVSIRPLGAVLSQTQSYAIIKAQQLEVIRVVLRAGELMRQHDTPGEITVQCLEGEVEFQLDQDVHLLRAGDLLHLQARAPHALRAVHDCSLLVTICLQPG
ncbi:cupin domain-containing protein [Pulveribacter sp.]|uniref:cupin domain-containing protein n=1 Tax=Pulveribacter sp. TaxID=2678893 RepID=UPI0028B133BC|nr:cupin domain-containing protein [Pulveribacter sp.]